MVVLAVSFNVVATDGDLNEHACAHPDGGRNAIGAASTLEVLESTAEALCHSFARCDFTSNHLVRSRSEKLSLNPKLALDFGEFLYRHG